MKRVFPASFNFTSAGIVSFTIYQTATTTTTNQSIIRFHETQEAERETTRAEVTNLVKRTELDVMALENVDVVKLQPLQALFHTLRHSLRAEIKTLLVPSALRGHNVRTPRSSQSLQCLPQHFLRQCPSVIPSIFHTKSIYVYV